jgi:hypothetical protein
LEELVEFVESAHENIPSLSNQPMKIIQVCRKSVPRKLVPTSTASARGLITMTFFAIALIFRETKKETPVFTAKNGTEQHDCGKYSTSRHCFWISVTRLGEISPLGDTFGRWAHFFQKTPKIHQISFIFGLLFCLKIP